MSRSSGASLVILIVSALALCGAGRAQTPPAVPGVDAPELAKLGPSPVGVVSYEFVQPAQLDPLQGKDAPAVSDRRLRARIWYPAATAGVGVVYQTALPGSDGRDVAFTVPGLAVEGAKAASGRFPLVILAHGYSNTPEVLSWLGENLASKGYVVVAPDFRDPPIIDRSKVAGPFTRRPLDVAFIARNAQQLSRQGVGPFAAADAQQMALIGYSMGGYGVLTAAGAPLNPALAPMSRGALSPYVSGGGKASDLRIEHVKAVVAISPASRLGGMGLWAGDGVGAITSPTLFIVGSQDHSVGYDPGVRTLFNAETHAPRYLLTFLEAGHSIALIGAPPQMQGSYYNKDWFEDPVWRKDRLMAIEAHFITAFLDRYVKNDLAKAAYLDVAEERSDDGAWPDAPAGRYAGYSPGLPVTQWKGFQQNHASGMLMEFRPGS